jgi:hypothetical protein
MVEASTPAARSVSCSRWWRSSSSLAFAAGATFEASSPAKSATRASSLAGSWK